MPNVIQRSLTLDDIPDLVALSKEVDWPDYNAEELTSLLTNGHFTGFTTTDGQVISCAGLFQYDSVASIGAVIVSETHRGLGLARQMIDTLLRHSDPSVPVVLTATVQGQPVYEKIGFQTAGYIHTYKAQKQILVRFTCHIRFIFFPLMKRTSRLLKDWMKKAQEPIDQTS
ncbi:GNAT family N-acetyltransferase [Bacillus sp. B6(2022)]|nr:GNAT family N-acetyltransferase [Bacillus sp. B6(2022)]